MAFVRLRNESMLLASVSTLKRSTVSTGGMNLPLLSK